MHAVINVATLPNARSVARRFADRWQALYANAVACLHNNLDELLTWFRYSTLEERNAPRITNAIECRFREVRRFTRLMGVFQDRTPCTGSSSPSSPTQPQTRKCQPSSP